MSSWSRLPVIKEKVDMLNQKVMVAWFGSTLSRSSSMFPSWASFLMRSFIMKHFQWVIDDAVVLAVSWVVSVIHPFKPLVSKKLDHLLFLTANSPWFGRKMAQKWLTRDQDSHFQAIFRLNHGELAIKKGTILFVSLSRMIFVFESLDFIEY
ncbi:hypothetical protein ACFX13_033063 [Malus domestica]